MKVSNQKPVELSPVYTARIKGDFDPMECMKATLADPLFTPVVQGAQVTMSANGAAITAGDIASQVANCLGDVMDASAEAFVKTVMGKCLVYFDPNTLLNVQTLFAIQSAVKAKLPFPSGSVIYTPATDVIPISKEFLAGKCDWDKYFATMAFYARPRTLGFYFANEAAFDAFKTWLAGEIANLAQVLPANTNKLFQDFQALDLKGLTESLVLRNDDGENNEEFSFPRTLISYMMLYTGTVSSAEFGLLPFDLGELFCPQTVVFVNVERHTHASAKQIADEWNLINQSINMKINMISQNQLNKLTATARNLQKIQSAAVSAAASAGQGAFRSANIAFRSRPLSTIDITKFLKKIMAKMATVAKSENSYKSVKMSFQKPNRRDPDDFNKQGKSVSTKYYPDIHLYIDTSGSISEENYQDAVKACILMAKKLNINIYFNSFSHCLSQCTKLRTQNKSRKQIYAAFQKVPKVSGGTDYEQIWHYINKSKKRQREISLVITDFEWTPPNHFVPHPKNLYYLPCSRIDLKTMVYWAGEFVKGMAHIDPAIRAHVLC